MKKRNRMLQWVTVFFVLTGIFLVSFSLRYLVKDYKNEIRTVDYDVHTMSRISELEEEILLYPWTEMDNTVPLEDFKELREAVTEEFEQFGMSLIWGFQEAGLIGSFHCEGDIVPYVRLEEKNGRAFYDRIPLDSTDGKAGDYYFSMVISESYGLEYVELLFEPHEDVTLEDSALQEIERKLQSDLEAFRGDVVEKENYIAWDEFYNEAINEEKEIKDQKKSEANIYQNFLHLWDFMGNLGWSNIEFNRDFFLSSVYWNDAEFLENQGKYLIVFSGSEEYGAEGQELILIYNPILGGITGCSMRY